MNDGTHYQLETLLEGLQFPEAPRWYNDKLWFSDMVAEKIIAVGLDGNSEIVLEMDDRPSGLGWLPDGRFILVSMQKRQLLSLEAGTISQYADLEPFSDYKFNDMVIDKHGNAYIGNFGFDLDNEGWDGYKKTNLVLVKSNGDKSVVAENMGFPNGSVIFPDGKTIVVAETRESQLTAFDINDDGSLSNRRIWAKLECGDSVCQEPDGICLDEGFGIWVASPTTSEVVRVLEGGEITDRIKTKNAPYACMLGGEHRDILFICTSNIYSGDNNEAVNGKIEYVSVRIPGIGLP